MAKKKRILWSVTLLMAAGVLAQAAQASDEWSSRRGFQKGDLEAFMGRKLGWNGRDNEMGPFQNWMGPASCQYIEITVNPMMRVPEHYVLFGAAEEYAYTSPMAYFPTEVTRIRTSPKGASVRDASALELSLVIESGSVRRLVNLTLFKDRSGELDRVAYHSHWENAGLRGLVHGKKRSHEHSFECARP